MRSVGIENSVTSLALTTHQANNEQYQRSADEAENFVNGSTAPTASPPEEGLPPKQIPKRQTQDELPRKKGYLLNRSLKRIYNLKKQEKTWMCEPDTYELVTCNL